MISYIIDNRLNNCYYIGVKLNRRIVTLWGDLLFRQWIKIFRYKGGVNMFKFMNKQDGGIVSPIDGKCKNIEDVPDKSISTRMMVIALQLFHQIILFHL